jgi:hypothetical protein
MKRGGRMKKILMPVIFSIAYIALVIFMAYNVFFSPGPMVLKIIMGGVILATAPAMAYVLVQRIKELKEEDKDDIGKY